MKHLRVHELTAVTEKGVSTGIKDKEKKKKMPRRKKNQTHLSACFPFYIPQKVPGEKWVQLIPLSLSVGLFTECPLALF